MAARGRQAGPRDDRRHAPDGGSHGGHPAQKGALPRCIERTKGGQNSKLHAVNDGQGQPVVMLLTEGRASNYGGAALLLNAFPSAKELITDKSFDGNGFRNALTQRGIAACNLSKRNRKIAIPHNRTLGR